MGGPMRAGPATTRAVRAEVSGAREGGRAFRRAGAIGEVREGAWSGCRMECARRSATSRDVIELMISRPRSNPLKRLLILVISRHITGWGRSRVVKRRIKLFKN